MKIAVTTVTQTANEVLGVEAKNLYYLILSTDKDQKMIINVGKKTHDNVQALLDSEAQEALKQQENANTTQKTKLVK